MVRVTREMKGLWADRAKGEGVSLNALIVASVEGRCAEPLPPPEEVELTKQHAAARQILPLIFEAEENGQDVSYKDLLAAIGRNSRNEGKFMGGACNLIDAACAQARVPLIATWRVTMAGGEENPKAWTPEFGKELRDKARFHVFDDEDRRKIVEALDFFAAKKMGGPLAWQYVLSQPEFADWHRGLLTPVIRSRRSWTVKLPDEEPVSMKSWAREYMPQLVGTSQEIGRALAKLPGWSLETTPTEFRLIAPSNWRETL
jgi:hypothetical protein